MFNGKKIKQLEDRVAKLQSAVEDLYRSVADLNLNLENQGDELYQLYQLYKKLQEKPKQKAPAPETPKQETPVETKKPKRRGRPRKNGKETSETAK